jgi:hypothetical protein
MKWFNRSTASDVNWTKNLLVATISQELASLDPKVHKDKLTFTGSNGAVLNLDFIASNYADKDKVELNADIYFLVDGQRIEWVDLFHITKHLLQKWHRPLSIGKHELWGKSELRKDVLDIYEPLFKTLVSDRVYDFLSGKPQEVDGRVIKLSVDSKDEEWIIKASADTLEKLKASRT